jgi:hypothetical protein
MSQSLPVSDFRWLDESEIEHIDVQNIAEDCDEDYVIECDFAYPEHLHLNDSIDLPSKQIVCLLWNFFSKLLFAFFLISVLKSIYCFSHAL